MTVSHKIKHRISFLFSNSTSGYIEKEIWKDIYIAIFTPALVTIAKRWKQPEYLSIDK
jgi:hypothetical protein